MTRSSPGTEQAIARLRASLVDDGVTEFANADPIEDVRVLLAEYDRVVGVAQASIDGHTRFCAIHTTGDCSCKDPEIIGQPQTPLMREALDALLAFRHGDTKHLTQEHARILYDALSRPHLGSQK
jgi:hypothetical protein